MRACALGLLAALLLPGFAFAADPKRAAGTETLSAAGFFVASVNVAQLWDAPELAGAKKGLLAKFDPMLKEFKEVTGFDIADVERITVSAPKLERGEKSFSVFITARKPFDVAKHMAKMEAVQIDEARKTDEKIPVEITGKSVFIKDHHVMIAVDDRTLALPIAETMDVVELLAELKTGKPARDGPLTEALGLAAKHTFVIGADFAPARKALAAVADPDDEAFKPLFNMLQAERGLLTFDFGAKIALQAKLTFFEAETAQKVEPSVKGILDLARVFIGKQLKDKGLAAETRAVLDPILNFADAALEKADIKLDGKVLTARAGGSTDAALKKSMEALPAWAAAEAERMKTSNNLKQLGLAMHAYHDANEHFPQDITDKDGKAILSWRVHLLPYLEQSDLYQKLDLTKPWDDKANKELLEKMPEVFKLAGRDPKEKGFTYFQTFTSEKEPEGGSPLLVPGVKRKFGSITDGTSNTLMIVEGAEAVNWLKPSDLVYDPKKLPKVGRDGWFFAAFCDGTARRIRIPKDDVLKALITVDGGEVVNDED